MIASKLLDYGYSTFDTLNIITGVNFKNPNVVIRTLALPVLQLLKFRGVDFSLNPKYSAHSLFHDPHHIPNTHSLVPQVQYCRRTMAEVASKDGHLLLLVEAIRPRHSAIPDFGQQKLGLEAHKEASKFGNIESLAALHQLGVLHYSHELIFPAFEDLLGGIDGMHVSLTTGRYIYSQIAQAIDELEWHLLQGFDASLQPLALWSTATKFATNNGYFDSWQQTRILTHLLYHGADTHVRVWFSDESEDLMVSACRRSAKLREGISFSGSPEMVVGSSGKSNRTYFEALRNAGYFCFMDEDEMELWWDAGEDYGDGGEQWFDALDYQPQNDHDNEVEELRQQEKGMNKHCPMCTKPDDHVLLILRQDANAREETMEIWEERKDQPYMFRWADDVDEIWMEHDPLPSEGDKE